MPVKVEISIVFRWWPIVAPCSSLCYGFFVNTASSTVVQSALYLANNSNELSCHSMHQFVIIVCCHLCVELKELGKGTN